MVSKKTDGIDISVETFYQPEYSNPLQDECMFAYRINITNHNTFPVQLLRRHWYIYDSNATRREVEGEGVVGVQPNLLPGDSYQYVSGCNLNSTIGRMHGSFIFKNKLNKTEFTVQVPAFEMYAPFKLN